MPETQGLKPLPGVLAEILRSKRAELAALKPKAVELERAAVAAPPAREFALALGASDRVSLIAECKRRSPGAGPIRLDLDPASLALGYDRAGASALSVLTDGPFFGGALEDLIAARAATRLPVLRKDFTLDRLQVLEARAAGADAVLLIVRILEDETLHRLQTEARSLGMAALVEVHDRAELQRALEVGADPIGINNRDLANFRTDLATTLDLLEDVPGGVTIVSESGIRSVEDVERLGDGGVDAILVGETLLRSADPRAAAAQLASVPRRKRVRG